MIERLNNKSSYQPWGTVSFTYAPGLGLPICGLTCSVPRVGVLLCNLTFPLSPLPGVQVRTWLCFFPSYLITCVSYILGLRKSFCQFPVSFSENFSIYRFFFLIKKIFLAVLCLRCCMRAFSSCGEWGLLFIVVLRLLIAVTSLVAEHRL